MQLKLKFDFETGYGLAYGHGQGFCTWDSAARVAEGPSGILLVEYWQGAIQLPIAIMERQRPFFSSVS